MDEEEIIQEPKIGMTFTSSEEAYGYYSNYAKQKGFGVMKRTSKRDDDGIVKYITFACSKTQKRRLESNTFTSRRVTKTGCKAKIRLKLCDDRQFQISVVELDHDHLLSPGEARHLRCKRKRSENVKRSLEINDGAGIGAGKNYHSLVEAGGYENVTFNEKDCRNYIEQAKRTRLGVGDAEAVCKYFAKMQEADPNFFYVVDVDENSRIRNLFWADGRSRAAYEVFGDVITFDSTYLTNKYDLPFAPFVGVNHHGQSVLFGCGLLTSENIDSFVWLFQSWLNCMSGLHPKAIITDQCKVIQNAIEIVFPNARHRLCLWHIMNKLPEKLSGYTDYEEIKQVLQTVVYDSSTESEFENGWSLMIGSYNLTDNEWLGGLYRERQQWVPAYVKSSFWAGMSTTQRSESLNIFFKGYVSHKTTLKQFVELYDVALKSKVEKENLADYQSFNSWYECLSDYDMEKQFQRVYTNAKFKEFQDELKRKFYCHHSLMKTENSTYEYEVVEDVKVGEKRKDLVFTVYFNDVDCEVNCECRLFEFRGILCRHALSVLIARRVNEVPQKYILSRWRKDLKRGYTYIKSSYNPLRQQTERCEKLCKEFQKVAILAVDFEDKYQLVLKAIEELKAKVANDELIDNQTIQRSASPSQCCADNQTPSTTNKVIRFQGYINQSWSGVYGGTQQTIPNRNFPQENPYTFKSSKDQHPKM